jgi:hypothetical protein
VLQVLAEFYARHPPASPGPSFRTQLLGLAAVQEAICHRRAVCREAFLTALLNRGSDFPAAGLMRKADIKIASSPISP